MNIDTTLLQACRKNDRKAQSQLYKSCFGLLMSVCIRYKNDEAEARAVLNQGFLKILTNLDKYDSKIPFEAWIRRIMINTIIDEFRKIKSSGIVEIIRVYNGEVVCMDIRDKTSLWCGSIEDFLEIANLYADLNGNPFYKTVHKMVG